MNKMIVNTEVIARMDQTLMRSIMMFWKHNNYGSGEEDKNEQYGVVEHWEWEPVTYDM